MFHNVEQAVHWASPWHRTRCRSETVGDTHIMKNLCAADDVYIRKTDTGCTKTTSSSKLADGEGRNQMVLRRDPTMIYAPQTATKSDRTRPLRICSLGPLDCKSFMLAKRRFSEDARRGGGGGAGRRRSFSCVKRGVPSSSGTLSGSAFIYMICKICCPSWTEPWSAETPSPRGPRKRECHWARRHRQLHPLWGLLGLV